MPSIQTELYGSLAILPQQAEAPVKETLEFLTDMMESFNGSEQRLQLRTKARQSFEFEIPLRLSEFPAMFNTVYGALPYKWAVPVWSEAQFVGNVANGSDTIACDTVFYDLRASSLAMIYSGFNWQILEIQTIDAVSITLASPAVGMNNAFLIPVRVGYVSGNLKNTTNGNFGKVSVKFVVEDNLEFEPDAPTQYLTKDIYFDAPLINGDTLDNEFTRRIDITDGDLGPIELRSPWLNSKYIRPYFVSTNIRSEIYDFRKFVYRRAGKLNDFYFPSHEINFHVTNLTTIGTTLTVKNETYDFSGTRSSVGILKKDGTWITAGISNPTTLLSGDIQFTLSRNIALNPADILFTCYLGLYRLNTDSIQINWLTNGIMEADLQIIELTP